MSPSGMVASKRVPTMSIFKNFKIFQKAAIAIFTIFMGLMILVIVVAYSRTSGHTGLDMGKIQLMRSTASQQDTNN